MLRLISRIEFYTLFCKSNKCFRFQSRSAKDMALKFKNQSTFSSSDISDMSDSSDNSVKKPSTKKKTKSKKNKDDDWIDDSLDDNFDDNDNYSNIKTKASRPKGVSKVILKNGLIQIADDTICNCYNILKILENSEYRILFSILETTEYLSRNSQGKDLSSIRKMIETGNISNYDDFKSHIFSVLKQIRNDFGKNTRYGELSHKLKKTFKQSFQQFEEKRFKSNVRKDDTIRLQLSKFGKKTLNPKEGDSFQKDVVEELKNRLSQADQKVKLEAEWIIRIYYPALPYYSMKIDLQELPREALLHLASLVNMEF